MTSEQLARAMRTNPVVIRRILADLRRNGLVCSEKGHGGGWTFARDLAAVTLREVYEALGSPSVFAIGNRSTNLAAVRLVDGRTTKIEALYIAPTSRLNSAIADQLGCALEDGPLGPMIRIGQDGMTSVEGVYAAGDIARQPHSVSWAVADGVTAGTAVHRSFVLQALAA